MRPRAILSCFFAAYGVYLTFSALFATIAAVGGLWFAGVPRDESTWLTALQYAMWFLPLVVGMILVLGASKLGTIAAGFAGLTDDITWDVRVTAPELLAVLLAAIGAYLVVTEGSAMVRVLFLMFQMKAGSHEVAEAASRRFPDGSQLITQTLCIVGGVLLVKKSLVIALRILRERRTA